MNVRTSLLVAFALILAASPAAAQDAPFARFPALSPDGRTVAFSYQGDIWTVPVDGGRAHRLTIHEAYEAHPRWSPDGSRIAFVSDRWGGDDIFVMDADGGAPRRLTYHSAADRIGGWTPDGDILFDTRRTFVQVEREREIYRVASDGGTPDRFFDGLGYDPRMSPDGSFVAFSFGSNGEWRRRYRGEAAKEIWLYVTGTGDFVRLTDFAGNDLRPVWSDARTVFFVSERDGTYNLYRLGVDASGRPAGEPVQLTGYTDDGPRYFDVSGDGRRIVFERAPGLYVLDVGGEPRPLRIRVTGDARFDPLERQTYTDRASGYALSPDEEHVALEIRGEIFVTANDPDDNRTVRVTRHPYRDRGATWLNDHALIFASDRDGQYDLYRLESADTDEPRLFRTLKHRVVRLTETEADERSPVVAPDGKHMAFVRGRGTLVVAEVADGALHSERILRDHWDDASGIAWSPDSRWLAYGLSDLDFNSEVYIHAADGSSEPVNITQHPKGDGSPVWSRDGSKLAFLSQRNNGDGDVWFAWLREADWESAGDDWKDDEPPPEPREGEEDEPESPEPIRIDFEGIHERLQQVTSLPGNESDLAVSEDGETFFFVSNRPGRQSFDAEQDLYSVKWDGTEMKALTSGGQSPFGVTLSPEGKHLFMVRSGGRLARFQISSKKQESLPFRARMEIDHVAEAEQVFHEAWRILDEGFYDPDFHGADWDALRDKYWGWARKTSTKRDFRDVFNMLLGELNASHLALRGSDRAETQNERTGLLGVEIDPVGEGVRIERVISDSPADREDSKLAVDEVITAVDGESVAGSPNFYGLLADRADERTALTVQDRDGAEREVVIRPASSLRGELYEEWVDERRRLTDEYSGGRLGYIHIQGMNWPSFERFERELVKSGSGKDGLVVDVRWNGGGWTTDYVMAVLLVRQHAYTVPRGAAESLADHEDFVEHYPYGERLPLAAWTRPAVALANANSFSNAEIFAHAFKTLDRGTLVGAPTFGAVISTGGAGLIDGSFVRLPFRGWFVKATRENMENGPAVPDIEVLNRPDDRVDGHDAQLRAAVEQLLREIDGAMATEGGGGGEG